MLESLLVVVIWALVYAIVIGVILFIAGRVVSKIGGMAAEVLSWAAVIIWAIFGVWFLLTVASLLISGSHFSGPHFPSRRIYYQRCTTLYH